MSTDALKLYGPAAANLAITVAAYFHLRSQINGLKAPPCECNQDAILERLDKIEKALQEQLYPAVRAHEQFIRNHPPLGGVEGTTEVPPAPTEDQKDTRTTGKTTNKASPKAKAAPKAAPKTKAPEPSAADVATDADLDDELDQILEGEDQANIELEATEAPSETEPPPPKAKAKAKGVPKAAAKKSFKKNN